MVFNQWSTLSNQTRGTIYCVSAILILSPDSLCMRVLSNIPDFTVIFYRYMLFAAIYIVVYVAKEGKNAWKSFRRIGWIGAVAGIVWGISNFTITYAFQKTAIANALVINSANPMWSALFSWIVLQETIPLRTIITSLVAFGAIIIIFYGQLGSGNSGADSTGLVCALIASMSMGAYFVLLRLAGGPKGEEIDMVPCNIIAGLFVAFLSISLSQEKGVITFPELALLMFNGMFILPVSFALLTIGPSLISAPEVSLFSLIETVLGPFLVWMGGFEAPPISAIFGGVILISALAVHSFIALREEQQKLSQGSVIVEDKLELADDDESHNSIACSPMWIQSEGVI